LAVNRDIKKVSFVGTGNVAWHLAKALKNTGVQIAEVFSPTKTNAQVFAKEFGCKIVEQLNAFTDCDLLIVAIPDSKIAELSPQIHLQETLIVHTSGITPISSLGGRKRFGVFYPLQTFSKKRAVNMSEVPFCIEANNENDSEALLNLAAKLSQTVKRVSSHDRKILHLTAVMVVSNFTNHLYGLAHEILEAGDLSFDFLKPLIKETALKASDVHPTDAQTGPARRRDFSTLEEHLEMLKAFPENREIYKLLSEQIIKKYHG